MALFRSHAIVQHFHLASSVPPADGSGDAPSSQTGSMLPPNISITSLQGIANIQGILPGIQNVQVSTHVDVMNLASTAWCVHWFCTESRQRCQCFICLVGSQDLTSMFTPVAFCALIGCPCQVSLPSGALPAGSITVPLNVLSTAGSSNTLTSPTGVIMTSSTSQVRICRYSCSCLWVGWCSQKVDRHASL